MGLYQRRAEILRSAQNDKHFLFSLVSTTVRSSRSSVTVAVPCRVSACLQIWHSIVLKAIIGRRHSESTDTWSLEYDLGRSRASLAAHSRGQSAIGREGIEG